MSYYTNTAGFSGHWRDPVATIADLPTYGNNPGDIRETLDTNDLYQWTGANWVAYPGGGGGGGGGGSVTQGTVPWIVAGTVDVSGSKTVVSLYNEITSVSSGVLTTILNYTATEIDYVGQIEVSGTNIAQYTVVINGTTNATQRTYFGGALNAVFKYSFDLENGFVLNTGDTIQVQVIQNRPDLGTFEARMLYAK